MADTRAAHPLIARAGRAMRCGGGHARRAGVVGGRAGRVQQAAVLAGGVLGARGILQPGNQARGSPGPPAPLLPPATPEPTPSPRHTDQPGVLSPMASSQTQSDTQRQVAAAHIDREPHGPVTGADLQEPDVDRLPLHVELKQLEPQHHCDRQSLPID